MCFKQKVAGANKLAANSAVGDIFGLAVTKAGWEGFCLHLRGIKLSLELLDFVDILDLVTASDLIVSQFAWQMHGRMESNLDT